MRKLLLALLGSTALAACGQGANEGDATSATTPDTATSEATAPSAEAVEAETARLNAWFAERWEEELDFSPIFKTYLGRSDDKDKVDDGTEDAADVQLEWRRNAVAQMQSDFDYDLLTDEAKTSYDIYAYQLEQAEASLPFRRRGYVFHQMNGPHAFLPNFFDELPQR